MLNFTDYNLILLQIKPDPVLSRDSFNILESKQNRKHQKFEITRNDCFTYDVVKTTLPSSVVFHVLVPFYVRHQTTNRSLILAGFEKRIFQAEMRQEK